MLPLVRSYLRAAALCLGGGVALVLLTRHTDALDRSNADAQARARQHAVQLAAQAVAYRAAQAALSHASEHVTRDVVRYREIRDTLNIRDTVEVKVFVAKADSVVRSCTELVESCAQFRVRADSSIAGLTVDRDLWKGIAESQKPSKWEPVKQWALRIGIAYGAFRLGQAAR